MSRSLWFLGVGFIFVYLVQIGAWIAAFVWLLAAFAFFVIDGS